MKKIVKENLHVNLHLYLLIYLPDEKMYELATRDEMLSDENPCELKKFIRKTGII